MWTYPWPFGTVKGLQLKVLLFQNCHYFLLMLNLFCFLMFLIKELPPILKSQRWLLATVTQWNVQGRGWGVRGGVHAHTFLCGCFGTCFSPVCQHWRLLGGGEGQNKGSQGGQTNWFGKVDSDCRHFDGVSIKKTVAGKRGLLLAPEGRDELRIGEFLRDRNLFLCKSMEVSS